LTGNSFGKRFVVTSFGESHGPKVGIIIDGCPAGLELTADEIQLELRRRQASREIFSTERAEADQVEISSGVFNGRSTGAPVSMSVANLDRRSETYEERKYTPRPGQADLVARLKYGGFEDYRGGGRFSARITVGFVAAGAVARKLIGTIGMAVYAHAVEIAGIRARRIPFEEQEKQSRANALSCADPEAAQKMTLAIAEGQTRA
jgi:chorismate synthase